ncbi:MAG: hypothetical protein IPO29_09860 [Anaerolineae bacterium]|nr:hypothetical protein [Anaerolineae bacterium]
MESALRNDFDPKQSDVDENAKFSDGALDAVCREYALYGDALSKIIGLRVYLVTNPCLAAPDTGKEAFPIIVEM